jgi:hypothetical protein
MAAKKTPDLDPKMHETAPNEGEHHEGHHGSENGNEKHDLEESSLSQVATEDQEYLITVKTWIVVWVRKPSFLHPHWAHG